MFSWISFFSLISVASCYLLPGVYRISSVKSQTNVRSHVLGAPIYVTGVSEDPGLYELVKI
jgi:hypothetical protein